MQTVTVEIRGSVPRLPRREIAAFVRKTLRAAARAGAATFSPGEISIALVDDEEMTALNRRFRRTNRTTDVLTFPAGDRGADGEPLGDIAISVDQARRQARDQMHSLATEVRYLLVHGIVHAFGHDHETDAGEMDALEERVRALVGLE